MSVKTIHATVGNHATPREQVLANRGITMSTIRKPPNCFTFLRQCEVLHRAGHGNATQQFEEPQKFLRVSFSSNLCHFSFI